jgi:hypothetical protein
MRLTTPTPEFTGKCVELSDAILRISSLNLVGWLYLGTDSWHGSLFFASSGVQTATFESIEGQEALARLAQVLPEGEYVFETGRPGPATRTLELDVSELLRRLGIARNSVDSVDTRIDNLAAVPRLLLPLQGVAVGEPLEVSRGMLETLRVVDGERTIGDIVALRNGLALSHLRALAEMQVIEFVAPIDPVPVREQPVEPAVCPLLGMTNQPGEHVDRPTSAHSCFATGRPVSLALMQQRNVCLTASHATCTLLASASVATASEAGAMAGAPDHSLTGERVLPAPTSRKGLTRIGVPLGVVVVAAVAVIFGQRLVHNTVTPVSSQPVTTQVPTLEPTPVPTVEPTPVPTLAPVPALTNPRTFLHEAFADNSQNWPNDPRGTAWLQPGAYHIATRQQGQFVAVGVPHTEVFGDVTVRATFSKLQGLSGGGYGVIVRDQGPGPRDGVNQNGRYYVFEVGDNGQIGIWRRDNDHWTDVLPWTDSALVRPGMATNQLEVRASANQLTLSVNGTDVQTISDDALPFGGVGLFVGGDQNEVLVQDLTVLAPGT